MTTTRDVAIIGFGFSGTILGTRLAKSGASVLLFDAGTHPRFAIGESTIPQTSLLLSMLAARYDVPEIDYLAYPDQIAANVCSTCGIKRSFGFAYHRPGERYDPRQGLQFGTSSKDENHLSRQDIDAYLLHVTVRYGVEIARQSYRWAIANPSTRDLFGSAESFLRWRAQRPDPHILGRTEGADPLVDAAGRIGPLQ